MNEKLKKLLVLFLGAVVITGLIVFQLRRPTAAPAAADVVADGAAPVAVPVAELSTASQSKAGPAQTAEPIARISVPSQGWGRNPFLTPKEIADAAPVPPIAIVEGEPPPPPPQPDPFPRYNVTAIYSSQNATLALIEKYGTIRVGDQLGKETVKEITPEAVVLEYAGKIRKLILPSDPSRPATRGDSKP